jgi:putative transposase
VALRDLKIEDPDATLPVLIARLRNKHLIAPDEELNPTTCYRFLNSVDTEPTGEQNADRRRFEAEYPNAIWQCDVLHGPLVRVEDGSLKKAYLFGIMDDHSRLVVHAQFYLNETVDSLRDCLKQAIQKRGVPQKFYVDNGACYRSEALENTCAWIGTALVHSRPYIPQGRGKIERFFRTVRESFLKLHENTVFTLAKLNEEFSSWLDEYHNRIHSSLGTTPLEKFTADMSSIRPAPANLVDHFRECETRLVRRDRTVQLNSHLFEVPQGLIGKKVDLRYHADNPQLVEVFFQNYSHGFAKTVDVHVNARVGRQIALTPKKKTEPEPLKEAITNDCSGGQLFGVQGHEAHP